MLETAESFYCC